MVSSERCHVGFNFSGMPNLEHLFLKHFNFDLKQYDPFVNMNKLRQLSLTLCNIQNAQNDFLQKFPYLEYFFWEFANQQQFLPLTSLSDLKKLTYLHLLNELAINYRTAIHDISSFKIKSFDFFKDMTNLVILDTIHMQGNMFDGCFEENAFEKLRHLELLRTRAKKGNWMKHLGSLKSLDLIDLGSEDNFDLALSNYLTQLVKLRLVVNSRFGSDILSIYAFKGLTQLKWLHLLSENIEGNTFEGFETLTVLEFIVPERIKFELKPDLFKGLTNLKALSCRCRSETLADNVFSNLRNLEYLSLSNDLKILNENSFNGLGNLKELCLLHNPIEEFNMKILLKMPMLKHVELPSVLNTEISIMQF